MFTSLILSDALILLFSYVWFVFNIYFSKSKKVSVNFYAVQFSNKYENFTVKIWLFSTILIIMRQ